LDEITVGNNPSALGNFISPSTTGIVSRNIEKTNISISPNPFTSQSVISFSQEQRNCTIYIEDISGKKIKTYTFSGKEFTIEKGEMNTGIYFLKIEDELKNVVTRKIIVQ
jgi:hypothetical protein